MFVVVVVEVGVSGVPVNLEVELACVILDTAEAHVN